MRNQIFSRVNQWILVRGKGVHQSVALDKTRLFSSIFGDNWWCPWEILNSWTKILIDTIWLFVPGLLTMATRPTRSERTASQFWRNITSESIIIRTIGLSTECKAVDQNINRKITNNCPAGCLFLSTFFLIVQGAFLHRDANVNPWSQLSSWSEHSDRTGF